ncbi:hypothetical protein [Rhodococcus sp. Q]|uniref:hypothetical protein n=1 Tax=Rhodococcus sp. Q TaxID=2502252 RepID=UPI0010FA438D|nr:hypothetical protein [Rhodococcus sp. Q]
MTNAYAQGDMLALAREAAKRRLNGLAKHSWKYTPEQLTLLSSLLDEFARKSHQYRNQENSND